MDHAPEELDLESEELDLKFEELVPKEKKLRQKPFPLDEKRFLQTKAAGLTLALSKKEKRGILSQVQGTTTRLL